MKAQKIIAMIVAIAISSAGFAKEVTTRPNSIRSSKTFNSKVFDVDNNRKIQAVELSKQEMQETEGEFLPLIAIGLGAIAFGMWIKHGENYAKTGEPASVKEVAKAGAIEGATSAIPGGSAIGTVKKVEAVAKVTKAVSNTKKATNVVNNTNKVQKTVAKNNSQSFNTVKSVLDQAKPLGNRPNQVSTDLNDGTKVIFRKDYGKQAHPLNQKIFGKDSINHYNIEIKKISTQPGIKDKLIQDFHIVPQKNGDIAVYNKNWKRVGGSGNKK